MSGRYAGSFSLVMRNNLSGGFIMSMFYCYSTTLMHFLKANGLRYEFSTNHNRTGNRMWVFKRDERLGELLDEYDERKAQARNNGVI